MRALRIIVCIKQVPHPMRPSGSRLDSSFGISAHGPESNDYFAIEESLRLKETGAGGRAMTMGRPQPKQCCGKLSVRR